LDPLADSGGLASVVPPSGVVLLLSGVTPRSGGPFSDNSALALATLEAARSAGAAHVFLVSSASVYGACDELLFEDTPLAPASAYGWAKADMESAAKSWKQAVKGVSPGLTILRIGNVLGADQLLGGVPLPQIPILDRFPAGGSPLRSYIGPICLARVLTALFDFALKGGTLPPVLNVSAPGAVAMADILQAAGRTWINRPAPPDAIESVRLSVSLLSGYYSFGQDEGSAAKMVAELAAVTGIAG